MPRWPAAPRTATVPAAAPRAGPDCTDHTLTGGEQRRFEDAAWRRTEVPQPAAAPDPLADLSDCCHCCNGDCVESGSERCDFTCHADD